MDAVHCAAAALAVAATFVFCRCLLVQLLWLLLLLLLVAPHLLLVAVLLLPPRRRSHLRRMRTWASHSSTKQLLPLFESARISPGSIHYRPRQPLLDLSVGHDALWCHTIAAVAGSSRQIVVAATWQSV